MREAADTLILEHYVQMTFSSQYYCPFSSSSPYFSNLVFPCTVGSGTERQHSSNGRGGLRNLFFIRTVSSHIPLVQIFWCHKQLTDQWRCFILGRRIYIYTRSNTGTWTPCGYIIVILKCRKKVFFSPQESGHLDSQFLFFLFPIVYYDWRGVKGPNSISRKDMGPMKNLTVI